METEVGCRRVSRVQLGWRRALAVMMTLLLCMISIPKEAFAAEPTIDTGKTGTLSIKVFGTDGITGLNDVKYSYAKVGDVANATSGDKAILALSNIDASFFAALGSPAPDVVLPGAVGGGYSFGVLQAALLDKKGALSSAHINYTPMVPTSGGGDHIAATTSASGLSTGLYLIIQSSGPSNVALENYTEPFLVSLPTGTNKAWNYSIEATAKNVTNDEVLTKSVDKTSASVGSTLNYTLTATAGATTQASKYGTYTVTDIMAPGLTAPAKSQVHVSAASFALSQTADYTVGVTTVLGISTIAVALTPSGIAKINKITASETITIKYPAVLNTKAVVGGVGNTNRATLTYSHGLVQGVKYAEATVSTCGATVLKASSLSGNPLLPGAKFSLHVSEGDARAHINPVSFYEALAGLNVSGDITTQLTSNGAGLASFYGLAAGDYYLVETEAPEGYQLLASPVKITVSVASTSLTPAVTILNTPLSGSAGGILLPITGGGGIASFLVVGLVLMALAGGAYVVRSRRRKHDAP